MSRAKGDEKGSARGRSCRTGAIGGLSGRGTLEENPFKKWGKWLKRPWESYEDENRSETKRNIKSIIGTKLNWGGDEEFNASRPFTKSRLEETEARIREKSRIFYFRGKRGTVRTLKFVRQDTHLTRVWGG